MQRIISFFFTFLASVMLYAQEREPMKPKFKETLTDDAKMWLLIVFSAATLWAVMRTFRNKPEM